MTRKGWSPDTLARLGVERNGDGRWLFKLHDAAGNPCGVVRYRDDAPDARSKMRADAGTKRELWPRPEDVPGPVIFVPEGEPDAVSLAELGFPAVALPGAGKVDDEWPRRLAFDPDGGLRERVVFVPDCDGVGRDKARKIAAKIAAFGLPTYVAEIDATRDDGYDIGDVLVDLGADMARGFRRRDRRARRARRAGGRVRHVDQPPAT